MKNKILITIIFLLIVFVFCSVSVYADTPEEVTVPGKIISMPFAEPLFPIEKVIEEKITDEKIERYFKTDIISVASEYRVDRSVYLLEYFASFDYWSIIPSNDYDGLISRLSPAYPVIFVPIFGKLEDTQGNVHDRVLGYFRLRYNPIDKDYVLGVTIHNLKSDDFKDMKNLGFFGKILKYVEESGSVPEQVLFIGYPTSYSDGMESFAIIKNGSDTFILDVSNSLKKDKNNTEILYTVSEYREQRLEVEKEVYKFREDQENIPVGGNTSEKDKDGNEWIIYLAVSVIVIALICTAGFVIIKKRAKSKKIS